MTARSILSASSASSNAMAELKTQPTAVSVEDFIATVPDPAKRDDCRVLIDMMSRIVGAPAQMWGPSIIGFGRYTYVNTTKKPAHWPIAGFSPRKANLTIYVMTGFEDAPDVMEKLGRYTTGKSCLYVKRLADIDMAALDALIAKSVATMRERYETDP